MERPYPPREPFEINWGAKPLGKPLTEEDICALQKRLQQKADGNNYISIVVLQTEHEWIMKNVHDCYIKVVSDMEEGGTWIVIGADKASAETYYNAI
jgi:hypothetical protein